MTDFPVMTFSGIDPDSFAGKDQIVDYFVAYAQQIAAPSAVASRSRRFTEGRW
jgi:hypothetical protein